VNQDRLASEISNIQFISYLCDNKERRTEKGEERVNRKEDMKINKGIMRGTASRNCNGPQRYESLPILVTDECLCVCECVNARSILNKYFSVINTSLNTDQSQSRYNPNYFTAKV
jgi:hypothetical protein